MKHYNKNGLDIILQNEKMTPRTSISIFFKVDKKEKFFGVNSLLARLMLQGTKALSAETLAQTLENACIDTSVKSKQDYLKVTSVFLNEDFNLAVDILADIIENSTFDDFSKEVFKIKGEIVSDLDNAKMKLTDAFVKNIFSEHPYSSTHTTILEDIDKITKEDIVSAHKTILNSKKVISIVGDLSTIGDSEEKILETIENKFGFMKNKIENNEIEAKFKNDLKEDKLVWITKNDASQAQILQGWLVDSYNNRQKSAKIAVLNNILGSSGLSSRLFVNLRDKKGLAYNVRSQYEMLLRSAVFNMYIGTQPINIEKSLLGFKDELQKLADTNPDEIELKGAKENIKGRVKYFKQNNAQISSILGYDFIMDLGFDYDENFLEEINKVTGADVSETAKELLNMPKLIAIIAPEKYKIEM